MKYTIPRRDRTANSDSNLCQLFFSAGTTRKRVTCISGNEADRKCLSETLGEFWTLVEKDSHISSEEYSINPDRLFSPTRNRNYPNQSELVKILKQLNTKGLRLTVYFNQSLVSRDCNLIFTKTRDPERNNHPEMLYLHFHEENKISVTGDQLKSVWDSLLETISQHWVDGVTSNTMQDDSGTIVFAGKPWKLKGNKTPAIVNRIKFIILSIIRELSDHNLALLSNISIRESNEDCGGLCFEHQTLRDPSKVSYFLLGLERYDSLYLVDAPTHCLSLVQKCVERYWQSYKEIEVPAFVITSNPCSTFYLAGSPWFCGGTDDGNSKLLLCQIFEHLHGVGWRPKADIRFSKRAFYISCFCMESGLPEPVNYMALTFVNENTVRIVNAQEQDLEYLREKARTMSLINSCISSKYHKGSYQFVFERKLNERPEIIQALIDCLEHLEWTVVVSASLKMAYVRSFINNRRLWANTADTIFLQKTRRLKDSDTSASLKKMVYFSDVERVF